MFTVYGGAGFIGSNLVTYLEGQGEEVYVPDRDSNPADEKNNLGHVIYCIGLTADFRSRPLDTAEAHVGKLIDVLSNTDYQSFLYLSSTRLYDQANSGDEETDFLINPHDPLQIYSLTKLAGEAACLSQDNNKVRIARLSNVFGMDVESENFLMAIIGKALREDKIHLQTSRQSSKDYINIAYVVRALAHIAVAGNERVYNVAEGKNTTHAEIVDEIANITGCQLTVADGAPTITFPALSVDRLRKEFDCQQENLLGTLPSLIKAFNNKP